MSECAYADLKAQPNHYDPKPVDKLNGHKLLYFKWRYLIRKTQIYKKTFSYIKKQGSIYKNLFIFGHTLQQI